MFALFLQPAFCWQELKVPVNAHEIVVTPPLCRHYLDVPLAGAAEAEDAVRNRTPGLVFRVPSHFWLLRCSNVMLKPNGIGWTPTPDDGALRRSVHSPMLFGNDLYYGTVFPHQMINGAASVALAWRWLAANRAIGVLAPPRLRSVLLPSLGAKRLFELDDAAVYERLYLATPLWRGEDGLPESERPTWDVYGAGIFVSIMVPTVPPASGLRTLLYLARFGVKQRRLEAVRRDAVASRPITDADFLGMLQSAAGSVGFEVREFQARSAEHDERAFAEAEAIVGLHGGAFANMLWMRPRTVAIEINMYERLCYAGMAVAGNIHYYCYRPLSWHGYHDVRPVVIDADDFIHYVIEALKRDSLR